MKPLSLRFRPRWVAGGDELCRAAEELYKCGHHLDCLNLVRRATYCYLRAHLVLRAVKTLELGLSIPITREPTLNFLEFDATTVPIPTAGSTLPRETEP